MPRSRLWSSVTDLEDADEDCEAGCYKCLLSYSNQPDHPRIDRKDEAVLTVLCRLARAETEAGAATGAGASDAFDTLLKQCGSGLERAWLEVVRDGGFRLPDRAQLLLVMGLLVLLHFYLRPRLWSARVSPDFLLIALVFFSMRSGPGAGALAGFVVGIVNDALTPAAFGAGALAHTVVGYLAAWGRAVFFADNLLVNRCDCDPAGGNKGIERPIQSLCFGMHGRSVRYEPKSRGSNHTDDIRRIRRPRRSHNGCHDA